MRPRRNLRITSGEPHAAQSDLLHDLLGAQPSIVRSALGSQPAAKRVMDDLLEFPVVHGGFDDTLHQSTIKEH